MHHPHLPTSPMHLRRDATPSKPTATSTTCPPAPSRVQRMAAALRSWWASQCLDEREFYLSQSTSVSDLEQRMRDWEARRVRDAWLNLY